MLQHMRQTWQPNVFWLLFVRLAVFNAELSPERYWQGPRSQEAGGGGGVVVI